MMLPSVRKAVFLVFLFCLGGMTVASMMDPEPVAGANNASNDALSLQARLVGSDELKPVDNMHHFMEYIYEPVFNRLKASLEKAPADKAGWTSLKSDSLILAETSILLAKRAPEKKDSKVWESSAEVTYKGASTLYQSARKKDFAGAKKGFAQMLNGCKACHEAYRK